MPDSVAAFIRETIRTQAEPPRQVNYLQIVRTVFEQKSQKIIFLFGFGIALVLYLDLRHTQTKPSDYILMFIILIIPFLIAAVPFYYAYRVAQAIKIGRIVVAEIESVEYSPNSQNTLDAVENGLARGKWRLPEGQLVDFEIDQVWAKDLKIGSRVELLVTNPNFKGTFPIRPLNS